MAHQRGLTHITGVIRGKILELDTETGLPDGQQVSVIIRPVAEKLPPGEAMRRAFGGWSDDPEGLDEFLAQTKKLRDLDMGRDMLL